MILFQEGKIEMLKMGLEANLPTPELARLIVGLLDQLVTEVRQVVICQYHIIF